MQTMTGATTATHTSKICRPRTAGACRFSIAPRIPNQYAINRDNAFVWTSDGQKRSEFLDFAIEPPNVTNVELD
jgi:hypothetical protein